MDHDDDSTSNVNEGNAQGALNDNDNQLGISPSNQDVLFGRGRRYDCHSGNCWFREVVAQNSDEYHNARNKHDRSAIIGKIVRTIRSKGQFLKFNADLPGWEPADEDSVRSKVNQALRYRRRFQAGTNVALSNPPLREPNTSHGSFGWRGRSVAAMEEQKTMSSLPFSPHSYRNRTANPSFLSLSASASEARDTWRSDGTYTPAPHGQHLQFPTSPRDLGDDEDYFSDGVYSVEREPPLLSDQEILAAIGNGNETRHDNRQSRVTLGPTAAHRRPGIANPSSFGMLSLPPHQRLLNEPLNAYPTPMHSRAHLLDPLSLDSSQRSEIWPPSFDSTNDSESKPPSNRPAGDRAHRADRLSKHRQR